MVWDWFCGLLVVGWLDGLMVGLGGGKGKAERGKGGGGRGLMT